MNLIGINGYARSGKDTVGAHLIAQGYEQYAFAGPIRCAASCMFGIPLHIFEGTNPDRDVKNEFWGYSPREMLQMIGTEGGRELFRNDMWVRRAEAEWLKLQADVAEVAKRGTPVTQGMVITDVRFPNEAHWILSEGGIVLNIDRPGVGPQSDHASEKPLPKELVSAVIANHGTVKELYKITDLVLADLLGTPNI